MNKIVVFPNWLYIEPVTFCDKWCLLCYVSPDIKKMYRVLSKSTVLRFVGAFLKAKKRITVYWCGGGEIFNHPDFPKIINELNKKYGMRITHYIQTNASKIWELSEIKSFKNIRMVVSIDAPKEHHDWNRGFGAYDQAIEFCRLALKWGTPRIYVRCLITKDNIYKLKQAKKQVYRDIGNGLKIRFYIIKTFSNKDISGLKVMGPIRDDSKVMNSTQVDLVLEKVYKNEFREMWPDDPGVEISLLSDGKVYNCSEGVIPIGNPSESPDALIKKLRKSPALCKRSCKMFHKCFS